MQSQVFVSAVFERPLQTLLQSHVIGCQDSLFSKPVLSKPAHVPKNWLRIELNPDARCSMNRLARTDRSCDALLSAFYEGSSVKLTQPLSPSHLPLPISPPQQGQESPARMKGLQSLCLSPCLKVTGWVVKSCKIPAWVDSTTVLG